MVPAHAGVVAELHHLGIATGFLSSLGQRFLRQLYIAIPRCRSGFGFVCQEADGQIVGFIACAESVGAVYKQAIFKRGLWMALPILRYLVRPSVVRRVFETLRYPGETGDELPAAEVLSIVVGRQARGKGIGKRLMDAAFDEFRLRGVKQVKVAVGADNDQANAFYQRCGYHLALTRQHHGLPMNIYVIRL